ncbi:type III-B CRISPR module RAMP protein Cmr6 [Paenibacillus sp. YYML68]|uniref:type III-B CRISPR module RAMP protein Cmr6 n=1 Tax=Paenibacillus sp. YYML68 TaxID=2909250 RepID=UPI0024924B2F|nr:type III-B CRISPR module RAMP protein Cmr6 [Paenibacillus sp. YYML68]
MYEYKNQMDELYESRFKLLYSCHEANRSFQLQSDTRLTIGSGTPTVLDTYLTLHHIYGVPYLPGSALKGVTASYCKLARGKHMEDLRPGSTLYNELFGTTTSRGWITFHDAYPLDMCPSHWLDLDVMTPHHQKYNAYTPASNRSAVAPRDDDSPEPVPFLTVRATFQIMVSCEGSGPDTEDRLDLIEQLVKNALIHEGIGGKRNSGYGRFQLVGGTENE